MSASTISCACVGCAASAPVASNNVGAMAASTGFEHFFCYDGIEWICPSCWPKLWPAFELLDAVLGERASREPIEFLVRRWKERKA